MVGAFPVDTPGASRPSRYGAPAGSGPGRGIAAEDGWQVRLYGPGGYPRGAGVLVDADLVLTAARAETGLPVAPVAEPPAAVTVGVPGLPAASGRAPAVRGRDWLPPVAPGAAGLLLLRLTGQAGRAPARLALCGAPDNRPVLVYGYPPRVPAGIWARARLAGRDGPGRELVILVPDDGSDPWLGPGFDGAGVIDTRLRAVVGVVVGVSADARVRRAWMVSMDAAVAGFPALAGLLPPHRAPLRRGWLFELLDPVLAVPAMADSRSREMVVRQLPAAIASTVQRSPVPRFDVWAILRTCSNYPGGLAELVEVLRVFEGDSAPMQRLAWAAASLPPEAPP